MIPLFPRLSLKKLVLDPIRLTTNPPEVFPLTCLNNLAIGEVTV